MLAMVCGLPSVSLAFDASALLCDATATGLYFYAGKKEKAGFAFMVPSSKFV